MRPKTSLTIISILLGLTLGLLVGQYIKGAKAKMVLQCLRIENAYLEGVKVGREGGDHETRWEELERELCKP